MRTRSETLTETGAGQMLTKVEANDGVTILVTASNGAFSIQPRIGMAADALIDEGSPITGIGKTVITGKIPFFAIDVDTIGTDVDVSIIW